MVGLACAGVGRGNLTGGREIFGEVVEGRVSTTSAGRGGRDTISMVFLTSTRSHQVWWASHVGAITVFSRSNQPSEQ